jgi:spermidine synthase
LLIDCHFRSRSGNIALVKPFELLGQTVAPDGSVMKLTRRDDEYLILVDGAVLMSSRMHGSEEALASLACQQIRNLPQPVVLIGGLGMGFTLRATLDLLPPHATVVVAELLPAVVAWNRGPLGPLAGHPLLDKRVRIETADVAVLLRASRSELDAVLLDVDNGPAAFTDAHNTALYDRGGIAAAHQSLKQSGVLAIWAAKEDPTFTQRLRDGGFKVQAHHPRGRLEKGGPRHTVLLAMKA